jgi:GNAT superfamily N-acetyltransferase
MYKIQVEDNREALEECATLGKQYYDEVEFNTQEFQYNLSVDAIENMVDAGLLHVVTVRDELDVLVGFSAMFVVPEFTNGLVVAKTLFLYIRPWARGGRLFYKLMEFLEDLAESEGAKVLMLGFKKGKGDNLAERLGYHHEESIFYKKIGD